MWGCLPGTVLIANVVLYAIIRFILGSISGVQPSSGLIIFGQVVNVIQGFVGIVCMIMIPVGIIMAIVMGTKDTGTPPQPPVIK